MLQKPSYRLPGHPLSRRSFLSGSLLAAFAVPHIAGAQDMDDLILSFGIVTDVHYAQLYPDGDRYYKGSFQKLQDAMTTFTAHDVDFVIELGDFIDSGGDRKEELDNLREIDGVFSAFPKKRHYVLGNHDLQRFDKREFLGYVNQPHAQYSFDVNDVHFIVLDTCFNPDASDYGYGRFDWTQAIIPESGLNWLAEDLRWASGKPVIVFLHHTLHNDNGRHNVLNAPAVRAILESHGDVRAVFSGHQHYSTHAVVGGIHYVTIAAMVSGRPPGNTAYAVVYLTKPGGVLVENYGSQRAYQW